MDVGVAEGCWLYLGCKCCRYLGTVSRSSASGPTPTRTALHSIRTAAIINHVRLASGTRRPHLLYLDMVVDARS